jgi:VIT1/CCC1 family predicted Fe2+/Mn2+ transporter
VVSADTGVTISAEAHGHSHRDVSGGWLRPAVFGAMDGLVTNVALIAGVGGGGGAARTIVLTGLAGLAAGAFSMAAGEYISVKSQNELINAEVDIERRELARNPEGEARELAEVLHARGVDADLAYQVAEQISHRPEQALDVHVREELGVAHDDLPSPWTAAGFSFVCFAVGAVLPLLPYLLGYAALPVSLGIGAATALVGGGAVAGLTGRPVWRGAARQFLFAALAVAATYLVGLVVGGTVG